MNKNIEPIKKEKNWFLISLFVVLIIFGGYYLFKKPESEKNAQSQCKFDEMIFYYREGCSWCKKVKDEGTIDKIKQLGVKVKEVNIAIGPVRHKFSGVPTFVIGEKVSTGYKTFDDLKKLLQCPGSGESVESADNQNIESPQTADEFFGEKGENVVFENGEIKLSASRFDDNQAKFFNVKMADGKTVYFFALKDKSGTYRAAANACQVCFGERKGFRQEGDEIVCNNCGNRYPLQKIATEKGGCNPGPISPNLEIRDGSAIIKQADVEGIKELF